MSASVTRSSEKPATTPFTAAITGLCTSWRRGVGGGWGGARSGGGGGGGAPSPLRLGAAAWGASIARRARRLMGAPTAPPPPRCAIRPRARAARRSPARREQAGEGLSSLHVPRRDEARDEWDVACAALDLRRLRVLGVAAA